MVTKSLLSVVVVKYKSRLPKLANLIVVDNDKINRGFAKAANIGIKNALGKGSNKILLLNPDISISKKQIETLVLTSGDIISPVLVSEGKVDFGGKINWLFGRTTHGKYKDIEYVSGACMMVDKKVFEKIGFFDERFFMYCEDVDFCLRAKKAGFEIRSNQNIKVNHKLSKNKRKYRYVLQSNLKFINKWVPWYFKPTAYLYWFYLWLKIR